MLRDESKILLPGPILSLIAKLNSNDPGKKIQRGIYEIGHFGSSHFLPDYEHYPGLSINAYGVCDNIDQILSACPELETSKRQFVITVTPVHKSAQESTGGWRWRKWGPYIGQQQPTREYLYDEPIIDKVLVYHIYKSKLTST